jgi:MraZ protein
VEERGGGVAELLGTHSYSLDPKGRVSLPVRFRAAFDEGLWLTVGQDRCLYCFPRAEWERRSSEVDAFALSDRDGRAFARLFFSSADQAKLDAQGRVTIPQRLRDAVGIKKDVVVLGVRERIEIGERGEFERYRDDHADAYENGDLDPRGPRSPDLRSPGPLSRGT